MNSDSYFHALVFIFGWIQKRTKKITAVMKMPDTGSDFAEVLRTRSHPKGSRSRAFSVPRSLKQRRISERSGLRRRPGGIFIKAGTVRPD
jgi:hypothetical protein